MLQAAAISYVSWQDLVCHTQLVRSDVCSCSRVLLEAGFGHLPRLAAAAVMVLVTGEALGIREQLRVPGKAYDEDGRTFRTKSHKLVPAGRYHQALVGVSFDARLRDNGSRYSQELHRRNASLVPSFLELLACGCRVW